MRVLAAATQLFGDVLGPDSHNDALRKVRHGIVAKHQRGSGRPFNVELRGRPVLPDIRMKKVHCRRPHEIRDEQVRRCQIDLVRRADLLDDTFTHHHDLGGKRHRLDLVMRDIDHRGPEALMQLFDFIPHFHPQLGIQVGKRLVKEKQLGITDQRAAHGDPLALTAGKLGRAAFKKGFDLKLRRHLFKLGFLGAGVNAANLHAEGDVLRHRHGRIEGVGLEHHRDVAVLRRHVAHITPVDADGAAADRLETGDTVQERRLTAAGRTDQNKEVTPVNPDIDILQNIQPAKFLPEIANFQNRRHDLSFH